MEIPTGCNATLAGLKIAKIKAHEVDSQLAWSKFTWTAYLKGRSKPASTVGEWLERYEANRWERTYLDCYQRYFIRIPADKALTLDLLRETIIQKTDTASRGRELD